MKDAQIWTLMWFNLWVINCSTQWLSWQPWRDRKSLFPPFVSDVFTLRFSPAMWTWLVIHFGICLMGELTWESIWYQNSVKLHHSFLFRRGILWDAISINISALTLPPLILDNLPFTVVYETLPLGSVIADKCGLGLCWRPVGDDWIHFCWKLN